jgi:AraC-like DNA-binding protein
MSKATRTGATSELATLVERSTRADGVHETAIPRLVLMRASHPTAPLHALYEPALCIVAQGRKQAILAGELYVYGPNQCLVISVDLPVVGHVTDATPESPYLCVRIDLDPIELGELILETGLGERADRAPGPALTVAPVGAELYDATVRLVRLLEHPADIPVLAPLAMREILYRLLTGEQSARLRQIALAESRAQSINRAIHWLKRNYAEPFRVDTLAREAGMSPSALHHHFKSVTAMSPLQYQKRIRLQEARRLMLGHAIDAATAALSVGYESPSQFSREYRRLFGAPPARDIARLRETEAAAV